MTPAQVVLGALQTLSLKRHVQTAMLATPHMMDWLLQLLSEPGYYYTFHCSFAKLLSHITLLLRKVIFMILTQSPLQMI